MTISSEVYPNGVVQFEVTTSPDLRAHADVRIRDLCRKEGVPSMQVNGRWLIYSEGRDSLRLRSLLTRALRPLMRADEIQ